MKKMISFVLLLIAYSSFAQSNKLPNGVYLNFKQFKSQTPAYNTNLEVIKRTTADFILMGGNDYKLESPTDSLKKSFIKKKIFAYVKNDSVYINCMPQKLQLWYAVCDNNKGSYITFEACMSQKEAAGVSMLGGLAAGAAATTRYLYVIDLKKEKVLRLTKSSMTRILAGYPELLERYNNTEDKNSKEVLKDFIKRINEL